MQPGSGLLHHFLAPASPLCEVSCLVPGSCPPQNRRTGRSLRVASSRPRPDCYVFLSGVPLFPLLKKTMIKLSERIVLGLIIITLLLPIPVTVSVHFVKANLAPQFDWIANRTLFGVTMRKQRPRIDVTNWLNGDL